MSQLEELETKKQKLHAMDEIQKRINHALPYIASATKYYRENLPNRRFSEKEIKLLEESYKSALSVWASMLKRKEREHKAYVKAGGDRIFW